GVLLGVAANLVAGDRPEVAWLVANVAEPIGKIFIRLLLMLVAPLLFAALTMGIAELEVRQVGRLGVRMLGYTVVVSAIAVAIGLVLVNVLRPGAGLHERVAELPAGAQGAIAPPELSAAETIVQMVPDN